MDNKRIIKTVFILIFIIVTGIFYSCSFNKKPNIMSLSQDASKETNTVNQNEESSDKVSQEQSQSQGIINQESDNKESSQTLNQKSGSTDIEKSSKNGEPLSNLEADKNSIYVHVCGAVKKPDVYKVKEGTRIVEAIRLAGGLTKNAAGDQINQAAVIIDGQQVYVPTKEEASGIKDTSYTPSGSSKSDKVNINTANTEELMTLTGIGEAKAKSIIDYRQNNGGFKNIEDIKNIDGIKESVFNKISDKITVN